MNEVIDENISDSQGCQIILMKHTAVGSSCIHTYDANKIGDTYPNDSSITLNGGFFVALYIPSFSIVMRIGGPEGASRYKLLARCPTYER